eukprot:gene23260-30488_t
MGCLTLNDVCFDQQEIITYDPRYNPTLSLEKPPTFDVTDMYFNWPSHLGNGDKFHRGHNLPCSPVNIRANTSEEVCEGMRGTPPDFEQCIAPVVLWSRWPFNVGETYGELYMRLAHAVQNGMSTDFAPVVATPHGLKIPTYTKIFLDSVFNRIPISLADMSAPQIKAKGAEFRGKGTWSGAGDDVMRVVFATKTGNSSRRLVNEYDLVTECNKWSRQSGTFTSSSADLEGLPAPARQYTSARCVAHVFGHSMVEDMALMEHASVLVGLHGAACFNSFCLPDGAALIEVRPHGFANSWANKYFHSQLGVERLVHWLGINIWNKTNSVASSYEAERAPVLDHGVMARERSVNLPWPALQRHLDLVADVGGVADRYYQLAYKSGRYYINDNSSILPPVPMVVTVVLVAVPMVVTVVLVAVSMLLKEQYLSLPKPHCAAHIASGNASCSSAVEFDFGASKLETARAWNSSC